MEEAELRTIINGGENLRVEFKEGLSETDATAICKEVAAMANTAGGVVVLGVSDDGAITGVTDPGDVRDRIERWCARHILPVVTIDIHVVTLDHASVLALKVDRGAVPPYAYKGRYYARFNSSSDMLRPDQLVDLLRGRSMEQALAALESSVQVAHSAANVAHHSVAPAIHGQGELATMSYIAVRQKLFDDLASAPGIMALQSGVATAQSTANLAMVSPASAIQGQGEMATMSYATLLQRLLADPAFTAIIDAHRSESIAALSHATFAATMAQDALKQLADLRTKLAGLAV